MAKRKFNKPIFRARLREFVQEGGTHKQRSLNQLAAVCGLSDPRRVTDWLGKGPAMPSAENLFRLAEGLGVSVDWLLGFEVPMMRGLSKSTLEIDEDVSVYVERAIATRERNRTYASELSSMVIDGHELLKVAIEDQLTAINEAWNTSGALAQRGAEALGVLERHLKIEPRETKLKINNGRSWIERLSFRWSIFHQLLEEKSSILRPYANGRNRHTRPLLELASRSKHT